MRAMTGLKIMRNDDSFFHRKKTGDDWRHFSNKVKNKIQAVQIKSDKVSSSL